MEYVHPWNISHPCNISTHGISNFHELIISHPWNISHPWMPEGFPPTPGPGGIFQPIPPSRSGGSHSCWTLLPWLFLPSCPAKPALIHDTILDPFPSFCPFQPRSSSDKFPTSSLQCAGTQLPPDWENLGLQIPTKWFFFCCCFKLLISRRLHISSAFPNTRWFYSNCLVIHSQAAFPLTQTSFGYETQKPWNAGCLFDLFSPEKEFNNLAADLKLLHEE